MFTTSKICPNTGKYKQHFTPNLFQKFSRIKNIMHWLSSWFYHEAKFGSLGVGDKKRLT
jgi:hypothetical protein